MNSPIPHYLGFNGPGLHDETIKQIVVFTFVIAIIAIRNFSRLKRQKMWHDTARAAIEKGQPLPPELTYGRWRNGPRFAGGWPLSRGLILIAVGVSFYLMDKPGLRAWAPLPLCLGAAFLVISLISFLRANASDGPQIPGDKV
jgi:hypothetical protein